MKILITGTSSGVGQGLATALTTQGHEVVKLPRGIVDLSDISQLQQFNVDVCDMLINCAGTGVGGKIDFCNHKPAEIVDILNVNLMAPLLLTHKALSKNPECKIVNVTSTNNKRFWPNDLAYSLSKKSLEEFGNMLQVEYPDVNYLEIRLGLTATNFNQNRYKLCPERFSDIYKNNKHLSVDQVVERIVSVLFDPTVKFIEVSP